MVQTNNFGRIHSKKNKEKAKKQKNRITKYIKVLKERK